MKNTILITLALLVALPAPGQEPCDHEALEELRVVDAHAHFFNLRSMPLTGIFYRYGLPWPLAHFLARLLWAATPEDAIEDPAWSSIDARILSMDAMSDEQLEGMMKERLRLGDPDRYRRMDRHKRPMMKAAIRYRMAERMAEDPSLRDARARRRAMKRDMRQEYAGEDAGDDAIDLMWEVIYQAMFRHSEAMAPSMNSGDAAERGGRLRGVLRALMVITSNEPTIVAAAVRDTPEVDVYVHHMLDLRRVYRSRPPFEFREQIERARRLGRVVTDRDLEFFVSGDLFRRDEVFDLVEAGRQAGAIGIKFYPPNGYRVSNTVLPDEPGCRFPFTASLARKRQFRGRYGDNGPGELNARSLALFRHAADHSLAIFSHHNSSGFQAGEDYGALMGAPCHWQAVLEVLAAEDRSLTVVLGHSGGVGVWFSPQEEGGGCGEPRWEGSLAQQAYNLCVLYENVYCDFGFPPNVLEADCRENFARRLEAFVKIEADPSREIPQDLCTFQGNAPPRYPIGEKIVYGSDWLVSIEAGRGDFACSFDKIFQRDALRHYRAAFFGENAARALHLDGQ